MHFESKDLSYIRRYRLLQSFRVICYLTSKNLSECTRDDVNYVVAQMHTIYKTPKSKETFVADIKYFWKILFPEKDAQGRPDETIVPYPVRHLSRTTDKSRQKLRKDKLTWQEFETGIREIFLRASGGRITESEMLIQTCFFLFQETVGRDRWVGRDILALKLHGSQQDSKTARDAVRKNIQRIKKRFEEFFNIEGKTVCGHIIRLLDNLAV